LQNAGGNTTVPTPLILIGGQTRPGLSATKIASTIIQRKSEAGLPIGALPSGGVSPDEIMERIRIEEIKELKLTKEELTALQSSSQVYVKSIAELETAKA
jgi:hypothetical protein